MYLWKAWHDHRGRITVYLLAVMALGAIAGWIALEFYDRNAAWYAEYAARRLTWKPRPHMPVWRLVEPNFELQAWRFAGAELSFFVGWLTVWLGLAFGASTMGRHLRSGSGDFLLTRPEGRGRAIWSEWALSVTGLLAILCLPVIVAAAFLLRMDGRVHEPRFLGIGLGAFLVSAVIFGLTQFMTTLTSSGLKGFNFSVAVILIYGMLPTALHEWWHWYAPLRWQDWTFEVFNWSRWGWGNDLPPLGPFIYWGVLALLFPLLTHFTLRRREV